jgi:acylglycerol lipase
MSLIGNSVASYRFRFSRGPRAQSGAREHAQLWANVGTDPRARMRRGSFFASDGAAVPYRFWPAREPAAAVLLLHGAFDYAAAFDEIGPQLARKGFTALAIDQRGFGATESRGLWSGTARMAADAGAAAEFLLGRVGTDRRLFVLGESMGGAVAIHAAATGSIPQLRGIVLAAPGALASRFRHRLLAWIAAAARFLAGDSELIFERLSGWELTPAAAIRLLGDPLVMRRIRPDMLCGMADLALSAVDAAGGVDVPVLTMAGARDELVRLACVRRLFDNLAGEKIWRVIPDAPHLMLHWRRSNEILREAMNWMTAQALPNYDRKAENLALAGNPCSAGARLG